jgi:c-di-GMP-binding flagellar brake protein YcgR
MDRPEQAMDGNEHEECSASQGQEARAHPRYSVDEDSVLMLVNHGMPVKARVVDLSLEGCRVRTYDKFTGKFGRPVEITFKVRGCAFRFSGVVRWCEGQHMVGIRFETMIPRRKAELIEVIEEMAAAAAARAKAVKQLVAEQAAPRPALPQPKAVEAKPAEPEAARASEPPVAVTEAKPPVAVTESKPTVAVAESKPTVAAKAIEPPAPPQAAAAETPAKIEPPAHRPAKARDRRAQARSEIDTTATILLVNVGSALRGHILDLSVGGCRIRTDEKFPVGIYTRAETEFHLQGLPFRLGGVIQAIHNRFMVGIRFLDLSERKRQQVLDLIDEIEQLRAEMPHEIDSSTAEHNPADNR